MSGRERGRCSGMCSCRFLHSIFDNGNAQAEWADWEVPSPSGPNANHLSLCRVETGRRAAGQNRYVGCLFQGVDCSNSLAKAQPR